MRSAWLAAVVLALVLAVPIPPAVAAQSLDGQLHTSQPAVVTAAASAQEGAGVQAFLGEEGVARLTAEQVSVRTEWEQGKHVDGQATSMRRAEETGVDEVNLTRANGSIQALTERGQVFVVPTDGFTGASGQARGSSQLDVLRADTPLAEAGYTGRNAGNSNGSAPGFAYRTEAPMVVHRGLQTATVTGSFQLFVNNASLEVASAEGSFEEWAGYRENASAPGVTEYELRVTVITVEQGRLTVPRAQELGLVGPALSINLDGAVAFAQAQGTLRAGDAEIGLAGESVTLRGAGRLGLSVPATSGPGAPPLGADVAGSFAVVQGPDALAAQTQSSPVGELLGPWGWIAAGLAGLLVFALLASRRPGVLRVLPARARRPLFERWLREGRRREDERAFGQAVVSYERARAVCPERPDGWYGKARALLEDEQSRASIQTVDEACERLEVVPLDLLEIKVAAAREAGEGEQVRAALARIAERSRTVARGLVKDLGLSFAADDPLAEALSEEEDEGEGGLRGYV